MNLILYIIQKFKAMKNDKLEEMKYRILKLSKRNMMKIVTIGFWAYIVYSVIWVLGAMTDEIGLQWSQILAEYPIPTIIGECAFYLFVGVVLKNIQIILIYLGLKFGLKHFKKDKLSEIDFKKYENYYREILEGYSPAELSYIDDFEIAVKNDIAATILSLKIKNKIELDEYDNSIEVISKDDKNLADNEKYIFNHIKDGKVKILNEDEFINSVKKDATQRGLLNDAEFGWIKFRRNLIIIVIIFMALVITFRISFLNLVEEFKEPTDWDIAICVVSLIVAMYLPFFIVTYISAYLSKSRHNNYIRTKKGEAINESLEGLRNYLKDYSSISEKDEKSVDLWEDYLIYSIIFNQNSKAVKNICDKYLEI